MRTPTFLKLFPGMAVLCLGACQCGPPEPALQVVVNIDAAVPASCVVLEVNSAAGQMQFSQELLRSKDKNSFRVGIKKAKLPSDVQLIARSFSATIGTGCNQPRALTSVSEVVNATFPKSDVATATVELHAPGISLDGDADLHIDVTKGGDDCNDAAAAIHPGVPAECGSTLDNDCDGKAGCNDTECGAAAICNMPAAGLAYVTAEAPVAINTCSPALTVELRSSGGTAVLASSDQVVSVSALPPTGVTLYADAACTTAASQVTIASGQARASFHFKASSAGTFDANATILGLPTVTQAQTVFVPSVMQLVFTTPARTVAAGACSARLGLETQSSGGQPVAVTTASAITLSANQAGVSFFSDATCTTALTAGALPILAGASTAGFYVKATSTAATTLTATLAAVPAATQALSVTGGPPSQLVYRTAAQGIQSAACSSVVTVETRDANNNLAPVAAATTVTLAVSGAVSLSLFSDSACSTAISAPLALAAGGSAVSFYFQGTTAGTATLTATSAGLTAAAQLETVGVGPPTKLAFSTTAQTTVAGQCSGAVTVQTRDVNNNPSNVTGSALGVTFTGPVTGFTLYTDPACATALAAPLSIAVGGTSATVYFKGLLAGSPRTIAAAAVMLTGATQDETVTPAAPTVLVFTSALQSQVAGTCAKFDLAAQDAFGNVSAPAAPAMVALASTPSITFSTSVTCASSATSVSMTTAAVTFYAQTNLAGAKSLTATAPFAMAAQTYTVTAGPVTQLGFTVQPTPTAAGAAITPAVEVAFQDSFGNTVTTSTASVTVAIGTNPGTGMLSGTATAAAVAGLATFANLSIDKLGAGYTLSATSAALPAKVSAAFDITPGAASQLVFTAQPTTGAAGASIAPAVQVTVVDALNNVVNTSTASITVAVAANPSTGVLSGTTTVAAVAGVATFSNLSIDKVGAGYTLGASSGALSPATSASFSINAGPAARLSFTVAPGNTTAGATIAPAVQVTVEDASGNRIVGSTATIALAIGTNPGSGALSGTTSTAAVAGIATFSNLSINKSGVGYTLGATSGALNPGTSTAFNIVAGPAAQVAFFTPPPTTASGATMTPSPQVEIQDALANRVLTSTANVTVAIANNAGPGGTLFGTATVAAAAGLATFAGLSIDKVGTGYTLGATSGTLTSATSSAFNITPGPAAQLAFGVQPTTTLAGASISPAVTVTVQDLAGNTVTSSTASIKVSIANNPGTGTLSGTVTVAAVAGVATFGNLSINRSGVAYTLGAASGTLTAATSASFNINPGPAAAVAFGVQPSNATAATAIAPTVTVRIEDASGNLLTSSTASVTVAIGTNPGGGALTGTLTQAAVAGVASFSNLSINKSGLGYTLGASSGALTPATSNTFNITAGAAAALAYVTQPTNTVAGAAITASPQVEIVDAQGNRVLTSTAAVALAIGTNPGTGTLSGTASVAAVNGLATFPGLSINKSGVGYTLAATSGALAGATSPPFNITAGAAAQVGFIVQPTTALSTASIAPAVQVAVQDSLGNTVTTSTASIVVAIVTNPSTGTLSGTTTLAATAGVATFSNLSIDKKGVGYTLGALSTGLSAGVSASFNITVGPVAKLAILDTPLTVAALACSPIRTVELQDAGGNAVQSTGNTVLDAYTSAAGVTFYSDAACTVADAAGTRTIANNQSQTTFYFIANNPAASITLSANKSGLISGTQTATIGQAAPTAVVFTTAAPSVEAGFCQGLTLERRDALGRATSPSNATTAAVSANGPVAGILFFSDNLCTVALGATFDILGGATNTLLYAKGISGSLTGTTPGSQAYTVTATSSGLTSGTVIQTVAPMVRRRATATACTMTSASVNCAITPTLADTTRTILFFQATPGDLDDTPGEDNVTCRLDPNGGNARVTCNRNTDGNGDVNIEWQTVSFPYSYANGGVSVEHVTGGCTANAMGTMPIDVTVPDLPSANRFVLFSSRSTGADNDFEDYFTTRLTSDTNLRVIQSQTGTTCQQTMGFAAQVVSWAGTTVNRGVQNGGMDPITVSQATTAMAQTFLLYTSRMVTGDTGGANECRRRLRGDITDASTLTFDRGCTTIAVQDISWEHVVLPATATVQKIAGSIATTGTSATAAISSVDLTRTVAFMGGMGQGGTASGRTDYATTDRVGTALARAVLTSATQLTFTRTSIAGNSAWVAFVVQMTP